MHRAPQVLEAQGVLDRCQIVAGDLFGDLPPGGDAYLLNLVLHDWDDDHAARILAHLRGTMNASATLLLIENVILPGNDPQSAKLMDLTMMIGLGGRERMAIEWENLLQDAGFVLRRIIPTAATVGILEAAPR